jgi:hypothetical protein
MARPLAFSILAFVALAHAAKPHQDPYAGSQQPASKGKEIQQRTSSPVQAP